MGRDSADHKFKLTWTQGRAPDVTLECIHHLREHFSEAKISVEVEKPGRLGLQELADAADVVIYSKGWAQVRFYSQPFLGTSNIWAEQRIYVR